MYTGAGRFMLNADNKRKIIKISQVQEFVLHTIPIPCLIYYNNEQEHLHNEDLETVQRIFFGALLLFTLIEIVYFYCAKIQGDNPEVDVKT